MEERRSASRMGARAGLFENDSERYRRAAGVRGDTGRAFESEWESRLLTRTARPASCFANRAAGLLL